MSEYHDSQLTAFGADLAQRASNGDTKFTITKATSTADDLSQTDLSQLITLPHEKQTGEIDRILPDPNGGTKVKGTKVSFDNLNLTENYPIQAMGLYAKEDVDGAKEQLYAVTTAADPETMPKSDSAIMFTFAVSIYVVVGNAKQVTINVNPDSFATKEYVADAIANVKVDTSDLAKLNQDNYYTGDNQFKYDPVNKDGDAYGLAKDIDNKVTDNGDGSIVVNGKTFVPADDNKVVHTTDMRKPASDVAGIEEVNAKQDTIGYTPADDSKVAHLSGANNFDTVPTVNNNPLLLASSLPSDIARTGQDQEFTGKNTFDTAPIDKATGNPYITKDGVPSVPSDVARTGQDANFTAKLQQNGQDVALANNTVARNPNTGSVSETNTFTAQQTFSIAPVINDASTDKGDNQAATMADLKSVEESAWHTVTLPDSQGLKSITMIYKNHEDDKYIEVNIYAQSVVTNIFGCIMLDLSGIVHSITDIDLAFTSIIGNAFLYNNPSGTAEARAVGAKISLPSNCEIYGQTTNIGTISEKGGSFAKIYYDSLVNN